VLHGFGLHVVCPLAEEQFAAWWLRARKSIHKTSRGRPATEIGCLVVFFLLVCILYCFIVPYCCNSNNSLSLPLNEIRAMYIL
jgi:hypothetical protein